MFRIAPNGRNRLDIVLSGKLDAEGMKTALDELVDKSRHIEKGRMLYDIIDFHFPSLAAIKVEFARLAEMLRLMKKFERAAVLTDKAWLQKVSELEGLFYPGLEIKAFDRSQKAEAEAWLAR
jgi:hypothetical protein